LQIASHADLREMIINEKTKVFADTSLVENQIVKRWMSKIDRNSQKYTAVFI
jgi:hypothetical protein